MIMDSKDRKVIKNKSFISSFKFACQGIKTVFKEERNMRIHVLLGGIAIVLGISFHLTLGEWLWLLFAIFLVWIMEVMNTIFENLVDMITDFCFHPIGKKVKDMAAGAVLIATIFAVIIGVLLFGSKFWQFLH
ncbi:diacylglycerol kinase family protein [Melissococcus plutonius]|nr:diacylglycerol kinase family protein [Melissococcus plutonius]MBB5178486.1 undecaprenol kinase [Melissococcus plutonius]